MEKYRFSLLTVIYRATLIEGTVTSLIEDKEGNIVGVNYKEKNSSKNMVITYYHDVSVADYYF